MRPRTLRQLSLLLADARAAGVQTQPPAELSWRDYCVMLLHVAAAIEHALMVQYLFAAYSLGGPAVSRRLHARVRRWQETILGVAKEEMGHLLTVQNLLLSLGAPISLEREDYPWDSQLYPFPLKLERLSCDSLAAYVCAESPDHWHGDGADEISRRAGAEAGRPVNRVGALYEHLHAVISDHLRDDDFGPWGRLRFDEWGRGYTRGARGSEAGNVPDVAAPDLLVLPVDSRASALLALAEIGEQGEAVLRISDGAAAGETSHFKRFLTIYRQLARLGPPDLACVTRAVAANPRATARLDGGSLITNGEAALWAHLFNLRYRMLLVDVAHTLKLAAERGSTSDGEAAVGRSEAAAGVAANELPGAHGLLIHRTFGEMYNLRSIAGLLVELPLSVDDPDGPRAGPPFEMPYTLDLPDHEADRWRLHRDLLEASQALTQRLDGVTTGSGRAYLLALAEQDRAALARIAPATDAHAAPATPLPAAPATNAVPR